MKQVFVERLPCARCWGNKGEKQSPPWQSLLATVKVSKNCKSVLEEPWQMSYDLVWKHKEGHPHVHSATFKMDNQQGPTV